MVFCYLRRGRGREDMGFLYVAEDGLVALPMESMHLEWSVERERERERGFLFAVWVARYLRSRKEMVEET